MSDLRTRELVRSFESGDERAGARLAAELIRAQALLFAVGALTPVLQEALAARVFSDKLKAEVIAALAERIDATDIANEINLGELAGEFDPSDIASELDASEIAQNFSAADIASELDMRDLTDEMSGKIEELIDSALDARGIE